MMSSTAGITDSDKHNIPGYTKGADIMQINSTEKQIDYIGNIVYRQVKSMRSVRQLHMSVLVPRTSDLKPAIIYFPGGGFTTAEHDKFIEMRLALAKAGYVVAAAEYRTIPDTFPSPVVDAKAAVRYLRQHATDYGIDPGRIGVLGDSAGGWLVQMLGTTNGDKSFDTGNFLSQSSAVQAVATLYGISDLRSICEGFPENRLKVHQSPAVTEALLVNGVAFRDFAGASLISTPQKALSASPVGRLRGSNPPFLIMHGSRDTLVSPEQSATLYNALRKSGGRADYVLINGAEHGDHHWYQPAVINRVVDWFRQILGTPEKQDGKSPPDSNS
ncbi:alpha/beta hydrolase [Pantoea dispersa]|uniref:alpha/beta hydrolase n=1 Tax=Pantoea dispersa TaxID=59814 RepID=UPI0021AEA208|nr:alpha/beta hydrolase [Pantoea dispersa]MCT6592557.1 alpha/beta hydrolase [Pantoea dispersa]